jgi:hypothetical protein
MTNFKFISAAKQMPALVKKFFFAKLLKCNYAFGFLSLLNVYF